jgi:myosin heavy subunit
MKSYQYFSNSTMTVQGVDEAEEYNHTIKAMHIMGISNDDIICKIYFILILLISLVLFVFHY